MTKKRTICLILIMIFSAGGFYTALHLTQMHYKKPGHKLNLIMTLPFMERWMPREQIEKELKSESGAVNPYSDPNFNPYETAATPPEKKKEACDVSKVWTCTGVDDSPYSEMKGIGMGIYGTIGYSLLILLSLIHLARRRKKSDFFSLMLYCGAFIGLGFSFGLTYIEHFILKMYCPYCVASAGLTVLVFICAIVGFGIEPASVFLKGEMFPTSLLKKKS